MRGIGVEVNEVCHNNQYSLTIKTTLSLCNDQFFFLLNRTYTTPIPQKWNISIEITQSWLINIGFIFGSVFWYTTILDDQETVRIVIVRACHSGTFSLSSMKGSCQDVNPLPFEVDSFVARSQMV